MKFFSILNELLSREQRRQYVLLQAYFFITAIVQIAGAASVAPFIALVSNPALIHRSATAEQLARAAGLTTDTQFLVAFAVLLMALIAVSNAVQAYGLWLTVAFAKKLGVELQRDIFHGYIHRDYVVFSRVNSATLVATVSYSISRFVYMVVTPLMQLISNAFVVVMIVAGLMWYRPTVGLVGGIVVGSSYYLMFVVIKRRLESHGRVVGQGAHKKQRLLAESLGGIKEIKLSGTEYIYEEQLDTLSRSTLRSETLVAMFGDLPRFVLETVALCALLGLGISLLLRGESPYAIVGIMSLYAMAGFRLLPAAQAVFKAASTIRANADVISELAPHVAIGRETPENDMRPADRAPMPMGAIEWRDVRYTYPGSDQEVLGGLNFSIPQRSIAVFVGSSGAGKSTMADLLLGLLTPTGGEILVGDQNIRTDIKAWQRNVGYVPQNIFILDDSIAANIAFGSDHGVDMQRVQSAAKLAQIDEFVQSLPEKYQYRVGELGALLSGGQRQRLGIARALYRDTNLIVMDEATSALDSLTERDVISTLEQLKETKTVVMIAHRLTTIKCADQIILVSNGELVATGSYDELNATCPMFREIAAAGMDESPVLSV